MLNTNDFVKVIQAELKDVEFGEKAVGKLNQKETKELVDVLCDSVVEVLLDEGKLRLNGFGDFEVRERAGRKGRNPQTGEEIQIAPSKSPAFRPAKAFKEIFKG